MKLSAYALSLGVSYRTAWRWFKAGKVAGFQADTGTIIVTEPIAEAVPATANQKTVIYTRVSAAENKVYPSDEPPLPGCFTACGAASKPTRTRMPLR